MAAITICRDFGAQENKVWNCFHCLPIYFSWGDGWSAGSQDAGQSYLMKSFMLLIASVVLSLLSNIPLCGYSTICLSRHLLTALWDFSSIWLLWINLLWNCIHFFFGGCISLFFLSKYLEVEFMGQMVEENLIFKKTVKLFSKVVALFYISTSRKWRVSGTNTYS